MIRVVFFDEHGGMRKETANLDSPRVMIARD